MIGQNRLKSTLDSQVGSFPGFSIVTGERGSESGMVAHYMAGGLGCTCIDTPDCKVETIRGIIEQAYKIKTTTIFNICNADNMSQQAQNALLKVTEEPPNKAIFVMVLEDCNNVLGTLISRANIYRMDPYTRAELEEYCQSNYNFGEQELGTTLSTCNTPGDVDMLAGYGAGKFYAYVEKVVNNISEVSGSNSFKIAQNLALKDTGEDLYDLQLFWRVFARICVNKRYLHGALLTSSYLSKCRYKSINRQMMFDSWILDIRREWENGCC